MMMMMMIVQQ